MLMFKQSRNLIKTLGFSIVFRKIFSVLPVYIFSQGIRNPLSCNKQPSFQSPVIEQILKYSQVLSQNSINESSISQNKYLLIQQCFKTVGVSSHSVGLNLSFLANGLISVTSQNKLKASQVSICLSELQKYFFKVTDIENLEPTQVALNFLSLQMKLECIYNLFRQDHQVQQWPLLNSPLNSPLNGCQGRITNFQLIQKKMVCSQLKGIRKQAYELAYKAFKNSLILVTNAVIVENKNPPQKQMWRKIVFLLSFPISLSHLNKAELNCYNLWRRPTLLGVKQLLDLPEKGYIKKLKDFSFPYIKFKKFLYPHNSQYLHKSQSSKSKQNIFQKQQNSGRILLLNHQELQLKKKGQNSSSECIETIIVYIHGGGFISMSSQIYQGIAIPWANQLKVPVFLIDYRKPPLHRFPTPLNDCLNAYKFIALHISQHFNIKPKNIILAGDSAGGNLVCSLQIMLMKQKFNILPKGILLVYPALDLRIKYSPSRLFCFDDGILIPSLLLLCQKQYLQDSKLPSKHPLISPLLVSQSFINPSQGDSQSRNSWPKEWPQTLVMVGAKDPLLDDSLLLLQRLTKSDISCKMILYEDFSHGFMVLDKVLPGCRDTIKDSIIQIRKMIENN